MVVLAYGVFLRFFVTELAMRPVLADVSCDLPDGADLGKRSVPLRGKLLVALPVINVVTGVVVAGLASEDPSLRALGVGVVVALVVAFTLSFELSALLARSVVEPIEDLREGTERVTAGDLGVRVPVLGTDETGSPGGVLQPDGRRASRSASACARRSAPSSTRSSPSACSRRAR